MKSCLLKKQKEKDYVSLRKRKIVSEDKHSKIKKNYLPESAKSKENNSIVTLKRNDWSRRLISKQRRFVFKSLQLKPHVTLPECNKRKKTARRQSELENLEFKRKKMKDSVVLTNNKKHTVCIWSRPRLKKRNVNVLRESDFANSKQKEFAWNVNDMKSQKSFVNKSSPKQQKLNA